MPRKNAKIIEAEILGYNISELTLKWSDHADRGICTMSPTLGKALLEKAGQQTNETKEAKHALAVKELFNTLFPKEAVKALPRGVREGALIQRRIVSEAIRLSAVGL